MSGRALRCKKWIARTSGIAVKAQIPAGLEKIGIAKVIEKNESGGEREL
jgi:hypothetical protein